MGGWGEEEGEKLLANDDAVKKIMVKINKVAKKAFVNKKFKYTLNKIFRKEAMPLPVIPDADCAHLFAGDQRLQVHRFFTSFALSAFAQKMDGITHPLLYPQNNFLLLYYFSVKMPNIILGWHP